MQLKSLEIYGFKSFAEKTTLFFNEGLTGIVGPNGCGKSNVIDAIRWVLGEQKTKNLRSEKMENIIFNGSKARKKANFAEVSITFENDKGVLSSEFIEVKVTRKLYRDGGSEYLLNEVPCRLKDITNLFLDTGVGADSYAIIELKMVEDILNDNAGARRKLFEESAGVSRYKIRKKETLRKLQSSEENLTRLEDVLFEIENNLKSLEKQAKKAEKFIRFKSEYKLLSSQFAYIKLTSIQEKNSQLSKEITKLSTQILEKKTEISRFEAQKENIEKSFLQKEDQLKDAQQIYYEQVDEHKKTESDKKIAEERLKFIIENQEKFAENVEELSKLLKEKQEEHQKIQEKLAEVEKNLEKDLSKFDIISSKKSDFEKKIQLLKTSIRQVEMDFKNSESQNTELSKEKTTYELKINALTDEKERIHSAIESRNQLQEQSKNNASLIENEIVEISTEITKIETKKEHLIEKIEEKSEILQSKKKNENELKNQLKIKSHELKINQAIIEKLEGFSESAKFLKKQKDWQENSDFLIDIFDIADEFKPALEYFLNDWTDAFVIQNQSKIQEAISLLNTKNKGKALFFNLEKLPQTHNIPSPRKLENAFIAIELLKFDKEYENLASHLFSGVYFVESIENIPKDIRLGETFVTLNGKFKQNALYSAGGSSSIDADNSRVGRKQKVQTLETEIIGLKNELENSRTESEILQIELNELKSINHDKEIKINQELLQKKQQEIFKIEAATAEAEEYFKQNKKRIEEISELQRELQDEIEMLLPEMDENLSISRDLEDQLNEELSRLQSLQDEYNIISNQFHKENIALIQKKAHRENLQSESDSQEKQIAETSEQLQKIKTEIENNQAEKLDLKKMINSYSEKIVSELEHQKKLKERLEKLQQETEDFKQKIRDLEIQTKDSRSLLTKFETEINQAKETYNQLNWEENSIRERLNVEFEIEPEQIIANEVFENTDIEEINIDILEEQVTGLRKKINNFGEVNTLAVEAFTELKERHEFILKQKQDLVDAKNTLLETIREIDSTAKQRFSEAFEQIRENFESVFKTLFYKEDSCDLILTEPENPLESEIKIIARPKGKRPLSVSQLSGGEKTLTAIALLFGVYLLKPAPFCIFDEVDAPLDDVNIEKFSRIIKEFSGTSQFILVTHNKRTMSYADIIYGVTMMENGISRVVPVNIQTLGLENIIN